MLDHAPMSRSDSAGAVGVVLAGGAARRMGGVKAAAMLGGHPLISYPLAAFHAAGMRAVVLAKRGSDLGGPWEVVLEPDEPVHPLCGILAALHALAPAPIVVCPCDLPFVSPALLAHLASAPDALAVAAPAGRVQPLLGRYEQPLAPALERALAARAPLRDTVLSLGARLLDDGELARFGDPARICTNVNSPADLAAAESALGAGPGGD